MKSHCEVTGRMATIVFEQVTLLHYLHLVFLVTEANCMLQIKQDFNTEHLTLESEERQGRAGHTLKKKRTPRK